MLLSPPVMVVSPHLDDAVFSCSGVIAAHPGCTVLTVLAGTASSLPLTRWDEAAGFTAGEDVVGMRRQEDAEALEVLEARPRWLPFLDAQYDRSANVEGIAAALLEECAMHAPRSLLLPLGLYHSDHVLISDALLGSIPTLASRIRFLAYEDALYRALDGLVQRRLADFLGRALIATPLHLPVTCEDMRKRRAVACYASQLRALAAAGISDRDIHLPERYWSVRPA